MSRQPVATFAEISAVRQYAERNAAAVRAFGRTPDEYVRRFEELKRRHPGLTVAAYTGQGPPPTAAPKAGGR